MDLVWTAWCGVGSGGFLDWLWACLVIALWVLFAAIFLGLHAVIDLL